jgi:cyclopropane fatty-acyl-phospholipid synthase-like methyltransferase
MITDPFSLDKQKVHKYYTASTEDYLRYYETDWHHHMHYGFERDLAKGGNPTENLVRYMCKKAQVSTSDLLLDAGCGVGGSAIWISKNLKSRTVGINLMEMQLKLAQGFSIKAGTNQNTVFCAGDFTRLPFKKQTFDVIWAIESSDHAPDKAAWVQGMYELLKPGGRLIVADGFRSEQPFSQNEERDYTRFLKGWAVPHLATANEFKEYFERVGFKSTELEDITSDVMPHGRAIFRFGAIAIPIRWVLYKLGLTSSEKLGNAVATWYQYTTLKKGLWTYQIFLGTK